MLIKIKNKILNFKGGVFPNFPPLPPDTNNTNTPRH